MLAPGQGFQPGAMGIANGGNGMVNARTSPHVLMEALGLLQQKIGALQTLVPLISQVIVTFFLVCANR